MKIALCVKQVPDTNDIRWTENNTIQREGVESILNPYDVYAFEFALKIKKIIPDTQITVLTMGPNQAQSMLRKLLALGCDDAVLISDRKFAGADTYATGKTIANSIKTVMPEFDLVVCGQFAIDGDTAQTGPCIANFLNIQQITYTKDLIEVSDDKLKVSRDVEDGLEILSAKLPVLVCVLKQDFKPSRPLISGVISASQKEIKVLSLDDIGLSPEQVGLKGSPTYVSKAFRNISTHNPQQFELDTTGSVDLLNEKLVSLGVLCDD